MRQARSTRCRQGQRPQTPLTSEDPRGHCKKRLLTVNGKIPLAGPFLGTEVDMAATAVLVTLKRPTITEHTTGERIIVDEAKATFTMILKVVAHKVALTDTMTREKREVAEIRKNILTGTGVMVEKEGRT
jgi:hypothetical protein